MLGATETEPVIVEVHGVDCELSASVVSVTEVPGLRQISTEQISQNRVRVSLDLSHEYRATLPQKVRINAAGLGELELLCVGSSTRSQNEPQVAHSPAEGPHP